MVFPKNPVDGQIVTDFHGDRYSYDLSTDSWINVGGTYNTQIVTAFRDGLVTPKLAELIESVKNTDFVTFKIYGNQLAYYYLFTSPGRLFKFSPEDNNLRIEIDRTALLSLLKRTACAGIKGETGPQGADGDDGLPGPRENTYSTQISDKILNISTNVEAPLDTEISFRLYNDDSLIEIWLDPGTSGWEIISNNTELIIDPLSIVQYDGSEFKASLIANQSWGSGWTAKIRQRGPVGFDGEDGSNFIVIKTYSANSTAMNAVIGLYEILGDLMYAVADFNLNSFVAAHLKIGGAACSTASSTFQDVLAAVAPSVDSNKPIYKWKLVPTAYDLGKLTLPVWSPDPACGNYVEFNWWSSLENPPLITIAPEIPKQCCQEDFFFCPNLGSCPVESGGPWVAGLPDSI